MVFESETLEEVLAFKTLYTFDLMKLVSKLIKRSINLKPNFLETLIIFFGTEKYCQT